MSFRLTTVSPESREEFHAELKRREEAWQVEVNSRKRKRSLSTPPPGPLSGPPTLDLTSEPEFRYQGIIFMRRQDAKRYALDLSSLPRKTSTVTRHVYWTDCSIYLRCAAGAIVWSNDHTAWNGIGLPFPYSTCYTNLVELFAVAHALETAISHVSQEKNAAFEAFCQGTSECETQPIHQVHVFTDSRGALERLEQDHTRDHDPLCWEYVCKCIRHYEELERLCFVVKLHLVPGHSGVPGNEAADRLAKQTARQMASAPVPDVSLQTASGYPSLTLESMPTKYVVCPEVPVLTDRAISQRRLKRFRKRMRQLAQVRQDLTAKVNLGKNYSSAVRELLFAELDMPT